MRGRLLIAAAICLAAPAARPHGQANQARQTPATAVRLLITGSFLGQFDGMFEYPSHSADTVVGAGLNPYGGLLGVETALKAMEASGGRKPGDLLLIAGDNPSHAFGGYLAHEYREDTRLEPATESLRVAVGATGQFFTRLAGMKPAAVALWSEDFFRALAPPPPSVDARLTARRTPFESNAGRFASWLKDNPAKRKLPTLASNASIRFHGAKLNVIDSEGVRLEIADDRSHPWTSRLTLSVPCSAEDVSFTLEESRPSAAGAASARPVDPTPLTVQGEGRCHADISLRQPLKPGRRYALTVKRAKSADARLSFSTDGALTPSSDGLPIVDPGGSAMPIIVAMVDPGIRAQLPAAYWEWTPPAETGRELSCAAPGAPAGVTMTKCEIVLLDPRLAFNTIRSWVARNRERYFALMSGLPDEDSSALLNATDLIKFVVLPTETSLLGMGSLDRDEFSGSIGNISILDGGAPPSARIWGRPEWIGETIVSMSALVSKAEAEWHLTSPAAASVAVKGRRLCAVATGNRVSYFAALPGSDETQLRKDETADFPIADERLYPAFVPDRTYDGVNKQGRLWIDRGEFASMVLDAMRDALNAEVAVFPSDTVDEDYIAYFASEHDDRHALNWMSREMLRRALFRAERVVRVKLSGSELISALQSMTSRARDEGKSYCMAGVGSVQCSVTSINRERLLINGRSVVPEHFYGVAMPAGVAARFGLRPDDNASDLVDVVDRKFIDGSATFDTCGAPHGHTTDAPRQVPPLGARLEDARARRVQPYMRFAPVEFTLQNTELAEPRAGSFSQTTIEGRDAKDRRTVSIGTAVDTGFDWRRATLRFIGSIRQGRDRIEDPSSGRVIRSEDPDEYSAGTRLDWKFKPFAPSLRFFVGGFVEGELIHDRFDDITPRPVGVQLRRYAYVTAGAEMDSLISRRFFRLRQVRASFNMGRAYNERTKIIINGEPFDLSRGVSTVVRNYKGAITTIEFEDIDGWRNRVELATLVTLPFYKAFGRDAQLEVTARGRAYLFNDEVTLELAESKSLRTVWKLLFPVNRLFSVGFEADNHLVWSELDDRFVVWRTKALVSIPLFTKRAAGFIW